MGPDDTIYATLEDAEFADEFGDADADADSTGHST